MVELRPHQIKAVLCLNKAERGIVEAPAGAGKTIIGMAALATEARDRLQKGQPKLNFAWVCNTQEQGEQALKAFEALGLGELVGKWSISCAAAQVDPSFADVIVVDECHHAAATTWAALIERCQGKRWGLSATPVRGDEDTFRVFELLGNVVYSIKREDLIESGYLAPAEVFFHQPNGLHEHAARVEVLAKPDYEAMLKKYRRLNPSEAWKRCVFKHAQQVGIVENEARNAQVISTIHKETEAGKKVLCLISKIAHGEELILGLMQSEAANAVLVYSKLPKRQRVARLTDFIAGKSNVLIATSLADEGLDIPSIDTVVMAAGGRSANKTIQRTGRALRAFDGKEVGTIHDFWDVQHPYLLAQSKARLNTYEELKYKINKEEK